MGVNAKFAGELLGKFRCLLQSWVLKRPCFFAHLYFPAHQFALKKKTLWITGKVNALLSVVMKSFFGEKKKPFTPTVFFYWCEREFCRRIFRNSTCPTVLSFGTTLLYCWFISRQSVCIEREIKKFLDCRQNWCLVDRNHESWIISCTQSAITNQSRSTLSRVERPLLRSHPFASLNIWTLHFSSRKFPEDGPSHTLGAFWFCEFAHCLIMNE